MKPKTPAQIGAIKRRPKLRPATRRMLAATLISVDWRRHRFVVCRRAGGVTRKTSVRFMDNNYSAAERIAEKLAARLAAMPGGKLADFVW